MSSYIYTTTTNDDFTFAELDANIIHLPEDENGNFVLVKTVDDIYSWKNVQDFTHVCSVMSDSLLLNGL